VPTNTPGNRLARETSPYLLQHAHNPVDWHPWGDEAFARARAANKLIFLSIGYSTCYWCHVMERESFESASIARVMNDLFINIKVDREERPDVDDVYMTVTQLITGRGGWPMSVWLVPDTLKPVHAGTYFPVEPRHGLMSFPELCRRLAHAWTMDEPGLRAFSEQVAEAVRERFVSPIAGSPLSTHDVDAAVSQLLRMHDAADGGFGAAPKFPQPVFLELLLAVRDRVSDGSRARIDAAVRLTLDRMATGGIYDQVGGGFHRYSTDEKWLVPHFEKMLYDNAQLLSIYARASDLFRDAFYAEIADEIVHYADREMTHSGGGGAFFSAQDAEVDSREGLNYLWTPQEVRDALHSAGRDDLIDFTFATYGLHGGANFVDPHHPDDGPKNVLFLVDRPDRLAAETGDSPDAFNARLRQANDILLTARLRRRAPRLDDKVLASWNGLMINALADAGRLLQRGDFIERASRAATFVLDHLSDGDDGLLRTWRDGRAKTPAFLEDYAMMIRGLLALHSATGDQSWLDRALHLLQAARTRFADHVNGGWFDTLADQPDLFIRTKSFTDGAIPCGNSVMLLNLLDLHEFTGRAEFLNEASRTLDALSSTIARHPLNAALGVVALDRFARRHADRLPSGVRVEPCDHEPVTVTVDPTSLHVSPDHPAHLVVMFDIAPGYHINAHEPGDDSLVKLRIDLVNGDGLALSARYPEAEKLRDLINIYTGRVIVPIRIEQVGAVTGTPRLAIRWQACTDTECLTPETRLVVIALKPTDEHR